MDDSLPTITEADEDNESVRSGKSNSSTNSNNAAAASAAGASQAGEPDNKHKEKKKKKKSKMKEPGDYSVEDHETAQQILVDLCNEMKELKSNMEESQLKTNDNLSSNLDSNSKVMASMSSQMETLHHNMSALDQAIESKATPEQIEELARIRAVQEMMKVVTDDKERTVGVYEAHARRGYEEIERLRQDLASERKEVSALRAELTIVRGDRQRMSNTGPPPAQYIGGDSASLGGDSRDSAGNRMFSNGNLRLSSGKMGGGGDFDDMTLETKGSYDTATYEMKSLKKRIIHMKKKLTVAQMEAKETEELRSEVERLRVQCETEKKASQAKDETIRRLEREMELLKRSKADAVANPRSPTSLNKAANSGHTMTNSQSRTGNSKTVVTHSKKSKWWQNL